MLLVLSAFNQISANNIIEHRCSGQCVQLTLYDNRLSPLKLSVISPTKRPAEGLPVHALRHRYQIVLTRDAQTISIFDHTGEQHLFKFANARRYLAATAKSGSLVATGRYLVWTSAAGIEHLFVGSSLVGMTFNNAQALSFDYQGGLLTTVTDQSQQSIKLDYQAGRLARARFPDGTSVEFAKNNATGITIDEVAHASPTSYNSILECRPAAAPPIPTDSPTPSDGNSTDTDAQDSSPTPTSPSTGEDTVLGNDTDDSCDVSTSPYPGFQPVPSNLDIIHLDARPASCTSYFIEFYGTERGEQIETGLFLHEPYNQMTPTVRSYPIVDFINGSEMVVVNSRDLGNTTFNDPDNPDALLDQLLRDGKAIKQKFEQQLQANGQLSVTEQGNTTTIQAQDVGSITLQVIIRDGMANDSHWQQLAQARDELLARCGIELQIVVIP